MCTFSFTSILLLIYPLVSVLQILDRYLGHLCVIVNAHAGYRVSRLLDTLRNNG